MSKPTLPPLNRFFYIASTATALFVLTIFAMLASILGDPRAPVSLFLDRYGGRVLLGEVAVILICGVLAMLRDPLNPVVGPTDVKRDEPPAEDTSTQETMLP